MIGRSCLELSFGLFRSWNTLVLRWSGMRSVLLKKGRLSLRLLKTWKKASMVRHLWAVCWKHGTRLLWLNLGPQYQRFGDHMGFNMGRSLSTKVASIIHNGTWNWPRPRCVITREIAWNTDPNLVPYVSVDSVPDSVRWILGSSGVYTAKSAWQALGDAFPIVPRAKCVRFTRHVPRWAFIEWLAFLGRLSTEDRLHSWGLAVLRRCLLCHVEDETHDCLFCVRLF